MGIVGALVLGVWFLRVDLAVASLSVGVCSGYSGYFLLGVFPGCALG